MENNVRDKQSPEEELVHRLVDELVAINHHINAALHGRPNYAVDVATHVGRVAELMLSYLINYLHKNGIAEFNEYILSLKNGIRFADYKKRLWNELRKLSAVRPDLTDEIDLVIHVIETLYKFRNKRDGSHAKGKPMNEEDMKYVVASIRWLILGCPFFKELKEKELYEYLTIDAPVPRGLDKYYEEVRNKIILLEKFNTLEDTALLYLYLTKIVKRKSCLTMDELWEGLAPIFKKRPSLRAIVSNLRRTMHIVDDEIEGKKCIRITKKGIEKVISELYKQNDSNTSS